MSEFHKVNASSAGNGDDCYVGKSSAISFLTTRNATAASFRVDSNTNNINGVYVVRSAGRGGGYLWYVYRSLFEFNLAMHEGKQIDQAYVNIYMGKYSGSGSNHEACSLAICHDSMAGTTADYDAMLEGLGNQMTKISDNVNVSSVAQYHKFDLNSDGIDAINRITTDNKTPYGNSTSLQIALVSDKYDYRAADPVLEHVRIRVYYTEYTGTSRDPYLSVKHADGTTMGLGINI